MVGRLKDKVALLDKMIEGLETIMLKLNDDGKEIEYNIIRKRKALLEDIKEDLIKAP